MELVGAPGEGLDIPVLLGQGCPFLFLKVQCPVKFRSNPNETHLNQVNKVLMSAGNLHTDGLVQVEAKLNVVFALCK